MIKLISQIVFGLLLSATMATASAVAIYPNRIIVEGKVGTMASVQLKVYGHTETVDVDFVKVTDLTSMDDKVLSTFVLARESQIIIPVDIKIDQSKEYYLCAILKKSQSMRLRVCSAVRVTALP